MRNNWKIYSRQIRTKYQKDDLNQKSKHSALENIKFLCESLQAVIKLFNECSLIASEAKYKTKHGEGLKILSPKQILQRLPIPLAKEKAGNTSEHVLN